MHTFKAGEFVSFSAERDVRIRPAIFLGGFIGTLIPGFDRNQIMTVFNCLLVSSRT
jgi:hypothetical protein